MEHTLEEIDGIRVVRLTGKVDVSSAMALRDLLGEQIDSPSARVLLDLDGVTLLDSSGIGILVTAHRRAAGQDARFAVSSPQPPVARVFELTRTNKLLSIHPTLDEALAALRA